MYRVTLTWILLMRHQIHFPAKQKQLRVFSTQKKQEYGITRFAGLKKKLRNERMVSP